MLGCTTVLCFLHTHTQMMNSIIFLPDEDTSMCILTHSLNVRSKLIQQNSKKENKVNKVEVSKEIEKVLKDMLNFLYIISIMSLNGRLI